MRRWHAETSLTRERRRRHLRQVHDWPRKPVECVCDTQTGRFRKRKALGCGRAHCLLCHRDKIFQVPRPRDILVELRLQEGLAEVGRTGTNIRADVSKSRRKGRRSKRGT